jgi:hypothetical protein
MRKISSRRLARSDEVGLRTGFALGAAGSEALAAFTCESTAAAVLDRAAVAPERQTSLCPPDTLRVSTDLCELLVAPPAFFRMLFVGRAGALSAAMLTVGAMHASDSNAMGSAAETAQVLITFAHPRAGAVI